MTLPAVGRIDALVRERGRNKGRRVVAHRAVFGRRQVIEELAQRDYIVVAGLAVVDHTGMIIGTAGKGAGGVTHAAVLAGRHMVCVFSNRGDAVAGSAVIHDAGVIKRRADEAGGVVTEVTVFGCRNVAGRLADRIDAVVAVMAIRAGLRDRVDNGVIEHTAHIEVHDTVAYTTVDTRYRVTGRPPGSNSIVVAGITALADNVRAGMVGKG